MSPQNCCWIRKVGRHSAVVGCVRGHDNFLPDTVKNRLEVTKADSPVFLADETAVHRQPKYVGSKVRAFLGRATLLCVRHAVRGVGDPILPYSLFYGFP